MLYAPGRAIDGLVTFITVDATTFRFLADLFDNTNCVVCFRRRSPHLLAPSSSPSDGSWLFIDMTNRSFTDNIFDLVR